MSARNLIWPTNPKVQPNGLQRFARVLHWGFTALAAWCVAGPVMMDGRWTDWAVGAVVTAMIGRTLRYIMGGE